MKAVSEEQMEISRLKAELVRTRMERDILKKRRRISPGSPDEMRLHRSAQEDLTDRRPAPRVGGGGERLPGVAKARRAQGLRVGKERVRKVIKNNDIRVRRRRRFEVTTDSRHDLPVAPNLMNREFVTLAPHKVWVGD